MNTASIQTVIQRDPMVYVSVAHRQSSAMYAPDMWYWEAWCFSDDARLRTFQSESTARTRESAQRIHDSIVRSVTKHLKAPGGGEE